ncbi:MAG: LysM peptidoglycan-binding domain-containing protein [Pirellulales bacterium]|nr:LysM peptidoglycan-binding domain-containing protein [Pirellulales bacterium]
MSKEAKIGLSVVLCLLVVLGGVVAWKLKSGTAPAAAQADGSAIEKSPAVNGSKAGVPEAGAAAKSPHDGKETPKALKSTAGQPPKRDGERDLFSDISEYRRQRQAAGEAAASSPPPSRSIAPPAAENIDPDDRYGLNRRASTVPDIDPLGPPGAAAASSGGRIPDGGNRGDSFGNRAAEDYRSQDFSPAAGNSPTVVDRSVPSPNDRGKPLVGHDSYEPGPNAFRAGIEREQREVRENRSTTLASARHLRGSRSYTVVEGDTLFDIARCELGKASRWAEIYELNQNALGKDFDYLVPGTELALPQDAPDRPDPVTQRPSGEWRR